MPILFIYLFIYFIDWIRMVDNVDAQVCRFDAFGKGFVKKNRLSPDGFFQLAIQLAYRR